MRGSRTERLIRTVSRFLSFPSKQISLTQLSEIFKVSKTVVSDDVSIIDKAFSIEGMGGITVDRGRTGGASFIPDISSEYRLKMLKSIVSKLSSPDRVLPGGLIYYGDILFDPQFVLPLGMIMASMFKNAKADIVLTTEVKGIPLALFTAHYLGVPLGVCRFRNRASDGSAVTVHYPATNGDVRAMYLGTRILSRGDNVVIIDDFMRGGSTASGMELVTKEFGAKLAGTAFFMTTSLPEKKVISSYRSLLRLEGSAKDPRIILCEDQQYDL